MAEKKVNIKVTANGDQAKKGLNNVTSQLNTLAKKVQNNPITKLSKSFSAVSIAAFATVKAVKAVTDRMKECVQAYETQYKAEKQLEVAAKNNPYLNATSVSQLKKYASQLQSISTVGDEQLLPLMGQLAAAGRNQAEIQAIMSAALDVSASGAMSLDSAVKNLNKTYSGLAGELGESIPQVRNLTTEELKQGKAVEVIAQQYKGMSEEVTKATGTSQQLANAWGDLKEAMGEPFIKPLSSMRAFFTELIQGWADAQKAKNEYNNLKAKHDAGENLNANDTETLLNAERQLLSVREKQMEVMSKNKRFRSDNSTLQKLIDDGKKRIAQLEVQLATEKAIEEQQEKQAQIQAEKASDDKAVSDAQQAYDNSVNTWKKELATRRLAGEEISKEAELQEELNVKTEAFIKYWNTVGTLGKTRGEAMIADINSVAEQLDMTSLIEKWLAPEDTEQTVRDKILAEINTLQEEYELILNSTEATEEQKHAIREKWTEKTKQLYKDLADEENATTEAFIKNMMNMLDTMLDDMTQAINTFTDIGKEQAENEASYATAELEERYSKGLVSEEEYYREKEKIEKKAAQQAYKMQLWQWSAQLLQIGVSTAQAVMQAWSTAGNIYAGIALAAAAGVAGGAQLAAAIANKPHPPSFSTGGFLTGNSTRGDKIPFMGNAGEAILNPAEMRNFMAYANGTAQGGLKVEIENYMGGTAGISQQLDGNILRIKVNDIVNDELQRGTYNRSLMTAQNSFSGVNYIN